MLIVQKNSAINVNANAIRQASKLLNTNDTPRIQKWSVNSLRNAGYLEHTSEGHLFGYDKYVLIVDAHKANKFMITGVRLQQEEVADNVVENETTQEKYEALNVVDNDASSEVEDITTKKLRITSHAIKESMNDFPELLTTKMAEVWLRKNFKRAKLIDDSTVGVDGKVRSMFGVDNVVFIVESNKDIDSIITVYKIRHHAHTVESMIKNFLSAELKKMQKKDSVVQKRNKFKIAELDLEKAELQLKSLRTKSDSVKSNCIVRIAAIDEEICGLEKEMYEVKREKTLIAQGIVYYA